jgi:replicative DNA helicase
LRQLIQLSNDVMTRCYEAEERSAKILGNAESRIFQIAARETKGGFQPTRELAQYPYREIEEAAQSRRRVSGLDTGFADLNRMTGGFHNEVRAAMLFRSSSALVFW